jgi:hypothetical protein
MTARSIYKGMLATDSADGAIIQDLLLPLSTSEAFVEYVNEELDIWPLWICPIRKQPNADDILGWPFYKSGPDNGTVDARRDILHQSHTSKTRGELILNFGVWGPTDPAPATVRRTNRELEKKLRELRGMKVPYAANFYTEDEFWDLYDRKKYDNLREKWHATALPSMYDKVRRGQTPEAGDDDFTKRPRRLTWKETILETRPFGGIYQVFHVLFG